jgi:hypothetical protein
LIVAIDWGGYFASISFVRRGKPMMKSLRRAAARVVRGGLNSAAWLKAMRSAGLVDWLVANPADAIVGSSIVHNFAPVWLRWPWSISVPSLVMLAFLLVNTAVHPASHSVPMLSRLVSPNEGKRSVLVASGGR